MDILKARQRSREAQLVSEKPAVEKSVPAAPAIPEIKEEPRPKKIKAKQPKTPAAKAEKKTPLEKIPVGAPAPEEMELSEEDVRELYKTQEMPELPAVSDEWDIPEGAKTPEEIELTSDDLNNLYKTQEMPELPDMSDDEVEAVIASPPNPPPPKREAPLVREQSKQISREKAENVSARPKAESTETSRQEVVPPLKSIETSEKESVPEAINVGEENQDAPLEFLSFMLDREEYALPLARISEIIKPREITEVPRCLSFVLGIISLRGAVIPVFDLAARLKLGKVKWDRASRIMVVRRLDGGLVGLAVDSVKGVVRVLPSDIEPPPPTMSGLETQFLDGVGRAEESKRFRAEKKESAVEVGLAMRQTKIRRKLVILLNIEKVAVL